MVRADTSSWYNVVPAGKKMIHGPSNVKCMAGYVTYYVPLRRIRITTVAVEKL